MSTQIKTEADKLWEDVKAQQIEGDAKDLWMAAHNQYPKLTEKNMHWSVRNGVIGIRVDGSLTVKGVQFYGFPKSESYATMRVRLLRAVGTCFDFEAKA